MTPQEAEERPETSEEQLETLQKEAGVADLMELYEKIEEVYSRAANTLPEGESTYTWNSTDSRMINGYMGRNT